MIRTACLSLLLASSALAQTTAGDILTALETPTDELKKLTAILEGADEEKSLTAMRLMLASGDPGMTRLALRAGITSTSSVARGVALEAYLMSQPTLVAYATVETEQIEGFQRWIPRVGSASSDTTGVFPIAIGEFLEDQSCFGAPGNTSKCARRLGGTELSFLVDGKWGSVQLTDSGELVGFISHDTFKTGPVALTIPLLGQFQ